jgi:hypothetical protein
MSDSHEQVRFEGLMAVTLKMTAMWDVTYSLAETYHHSVGTATSSFYLEGECNWFFQNNFYRAVW